MTKKEKLIDFIEEARKDCEYIAVEIETRGSAGTEYIINPACNIDEKLVYYKKAYNDDLVLNTYDGIRIVSFCGFYNEPFMEEMKEALKTCMAVIEERDKKVIDE